MSTFTHIQAQQITAGTITKKAFNLSYTADGQFSRDLTIPDSTIDQLVLANIDVSTIKSIYMLSDKDITIETNDGDIPVDTISLKAGKPLIWNTDIGVYMASPLLTDVTALYITNASGAEASIQIEIIFDATP